MADSLKARLQDDIRASLKRGDKPRVAALRLVAAAIKQREVDERTELDDEQVTLVLDRMAKQRRESIEQFARAGRQDLVDKETVELGIVGEYLPQPLTAAELEALLSAAIEETGASTLRDMGKVMGMLKPRVQGRTDMAALSARVKDRLG